MDKKLRIGIAGYGVVGQRRRFYIDQHPMLKTTAVCDQYFKSKGTLDGGVRYYAHYKDMLSEDLDALFVCLTNDVAAEVTVAGLERDLHVFCEKPPGRNMEDVAKVIACERRHPSLKLKYGFNHRYHDSVRDALRVVRAKELGDIINLRGVYGKSKMINFDSDWRTKRSIAGGGILLDQGIHMVDLVRLFAGEFSDYRSFVSNNCWKHDVEDNAYALMATSSGIVAMLHSSATQWRHRFNLEIGLSRGAIILSGILSSSKSYGAETLTVIYASDDDCGDPREQTTRYNKDNSWRDEVCDFAENILNKKPVKTGSSLDAMRTMETVYRIYCADKAWSNRYGLSEEFPLDFCSMRSSLGCAHAPSA